MALEDNLTTSYSIYYDLQHIMHYCTIANYNLFNIVGNI